MSRETDRAELDLLLRAIPPEQADWPYSTTHDFLWVVAKASRAKSAQSIQEAIRSIRRFWSTKP